MDITNKIYGMYHTLETEIQQEILHIKFNRPNERNSINGKLVQEMISILDQYERDDQIKVIILTGGPVFFSVGMDFNEFVKNEDENLSKQSSDYYKLLKLLSNSSKVIISKVKGTVNAGGIGIIAASDIVIADEKSTFGLSEALFGLIPAMVLPFLIRRVGPQKAQWMSLMTIGISATRAYEIGLVDELSSNVDESLRKTLLRILRLESSTIKDVKDYIWKLEINNDRIESLAVAKATELMGLQRIQNNIKNFVLNKKMPWEK